MKTLGDDGSCSQSTLLSGSSSGDSDGQSQVPGTGLGDSSLKLTIDDGKTFLKAVEETFQDQKEKYHKFIKVLTEFEYRRANAADVIAQGRELFEGHNNLISGFNIFLPKGKEVH